MDHVGTIDATEIIGQMGMFAIEWVSAQPQGQLWFSSQMDIYQCRVDREWNVEFVKQINTHNDIMGGLAHDGENIWHTTERSNGRWWVFDDGCEESNWLSYEPKSGEIEPDDEAEVILTLDATGLIGGEYEADLHVISNDPDDPDVSIYIILNVTGIPLIDVCWSGEFGYPESVDWNAGFEDLFTGAPYSVPVTISNVGTEEMVIEEISCDNNVFTADIEEAMVSIGESVVVNLTLESENDGIHEGSLWIFSDAMDEEEMDVSLIGETLAPPVFEINRIALEDDHYTGATGTYPLLVSNLGVSDLRFLIDTEIIEEPGMDRKERRMRNVTEQTTQNRDLREAGFLAEYFAGDQFDELIMVRIDEVIDFNWGGGSPDERIPVDLFSVRWSGQFEVEEGGRHFFRAETDDGHRLIIDDEVRIDCFNQGARNRTADIELEAGVHDIVLEMRENRGGAYARLYWGFGEWILIPGFQERRWLSTDIDSGTVTSGENLEVNVIINCEGLVGGEYEADLFLSSNDPDHEGTSVTVLMHVASAADIEVVWDEEAGFPNSIDWDAVYDKQYTDGSYEVGVLVKNIGQDDLVVDEMYCENRVFVAEPYELLLRAGEFSEVSFRFNPENGEEGEYEESMIFVTNDPDEERFEILLTAEAIQPPELVLQSNAIETDMNVDDFEEFSINVRNEGGDQLQFQVDYEILNEPELDSNGRQVRGIGGNNSENPIKDNPGDIIRRYHYPYTDIVGLAWDDDNNRLWNLSEGRPGNLTVFDPVNEEIIIDREFDTSGLSGLFYLDGILYTGDRHARPQKVVLFDSEGRRIGDFPSPVELNRASIASDGEHLFFTCEDTMGLIETVVHVFDLETRDLLTSFEIDLRDRWDRIIAIEWVQDHPDGQLWLCGDDWMYQFSVDDDWNAELVTSFRIPIYPVGGIAHDGVNLWRGTFEEGLWKIEDGIREVSWLNIHEETNELEPEEDTDVTITLDAAEATDGVYEAELHFKSNDSSNPDQVVSVRMQVGEWAQHYIGYVQSNSHHHLTITGLEFDGNPIEAGFEIGVFTPEGVLAGAAAWDGRESVEFFAYGSSEERIQFRNGERLNFRIWSAETDEEYIANPDFAEGIDIWLSNRSSVLSLEANSRREIQVEMDQGWNLISINVKPDSDLWINESGPDIGMMFDQLRIDENNHNVLLCKDNLGRFYAPEWGFNNIPYWDLTNGYKVKLAEDAIAAWEGDVIQPDTEIPLIQGWNMVAYYPTYQLNASAPEFLPLITVIEIVVLAKDGQGNFMSPRFEFSNMPDWREGQGYQIKTDSVDPRILRYPSNNGGLELSSVSQNNSESEHYWNSPLPTSENMSLLVSDFDSHTLKDGDQVAAFMTNGRLVGVGKVNDQRVGIALWGDDQTTGLVDGLQPGDIFELRLWDRSENSVKKLNIEGFSVDNNIVYQTDGFTSLKVSKESAIPDKFYLSACYPNPFNSSTRLSYGMPVSSKVSVRVFDTVGRLVNVLFTGNQKAGNYEVVWNSKNASAGLYLVEVEIDGFHHIRKVNLIK